jgi:hypothetical protein
VNTISFAVYKEHHLFLNLLQSLPDKNDDFLFSAELNVISDELY